jgi:hypothetical protein
MKKKMMVSVIAVVIMGGTLLVVPQAHAQGTTPDNHPGFFQGLMQFIEQKFGLDKTQVQNAVNEYKQQRKATMTPKPTMSPADMQAHEKTRLDKLVTDGKITAAQEKAIMDELAALHTKYNPESMKDATPEQRKTQMDAMQAETQAWAKAQGIDLKYVMQNFMGGRGGPGKGHGMMMRGEHPKTSTTPTPTTAQ